MDYEKTYKNNLQVIKSIFPDIEFSLQSVVLDEFTIITEDSSLINIEYNGVKMFTIDPIEETSLLLKAYLAAPTFHSLRPRNKQKSTQGYNSEVHSKFETKLLNIIPPLEDYDTLQDNIELIVCSGIGIGFQFELLTKSIKSLRHIIILDQDLKFLKLSMHIMDWSHIINYFSKEDFSISILHSQDAEVLSKQALSVIKNINRLYLAKYHTYVQFKNDFSDKLMQKISKHRSIIADGWGFYDDEKISLVHSIQNISRGFRILTYDKLSDKRIDIPLFIVANGPSIDDDILFLKKNRDKGIIISCGSALQPMYKNHIRPDFHVEIERNEITSHVLKDNISNEFLKSITLLCANVLHPEVTKLFKESLLFFRANDIGSESFAPSSSMIVSHPNPTATNAAISIVSQLGFKELYLFGCDMGFLDESYHHSKNSMFYDSNSRYSKKKFKSSIRLLGNFNSTVESTQVLNWARYTIEDTIKDIDNNTIFNCSNGAYINNTTPMKSTSISLHRSYTDIKRHHEINRFFKEFNKTTTIYNKYLELDLLSHIDFIVSLLNKGGINSQNFVSIFGFIIRYLLSIKKGFDFNIITGTLSILSYIVVNNLHYILDHDKREDFVLYSIDIIVEYLSYIKQDLIEFESNHKVRT